MMKRVLKSKKGASSVLVILLLLVLVVFGVAALTTSLSGLRLGKKVSDWSAAYYSAEGTAAHRWAEIDGAISAALQNPSGFEDALAANLAMLDFDAQLTDGDGGYRIAYEVWEGNVGLKVVLALSDDGLVLHPVTWCQITN